MKPSETQAAAIDPRDSTAAKTRAELEHFFDNSPTSIAEENLNGGNAKHSPRPNGSIYNNGIPDDDNDTAAENNTGRAG